MNEDLSELFGPTPECPPVEELLNCCEGHRGEAARKQAEGHVARCAHCATELAMYREFQEPEMRADERQVAEAIAARLRKNSPVARTPWWKELWNWKVLMPAAVALAALVIAVWTPVQRDGTVDLSGSGSVYRSGKIAVLSPSSEIREAPVVFTWQAVHEAAKYRVSLQEVDHTELWSAETAATSAELPEGVRSKLAAPKKLQFQVTALDARGATIADSGPWTFTILR